MTSNKYIVKKCPRIKTTEYYLRGELITERICTSNREEFRLCQNRTDCVIKQVIEVCKKEAVINYPKKEKEFITVNGYQAILNMFDIEEVSE